VYAAFFFIVALVFSTLLEAQFTLPKLVVIRLFAPILAALWASRLARDAVAPVPLATFVAAAALSVWWVISTVFAIHLPTALNGAHGRYNGLWNQELFLVVFLIVASSKFEIVELERMTQFFVGAMVPVSLYALVQTLGWDPIPWPRGRAASTFGNPVTLAAALGLALPFALVFAMLARRRTERFLWGTTVVLLELASLATWSRGPTVATLVASLGLLAATGWEARARLNRWAIGAVIIVTLPVLAVGYRQVVRARIALHTASPLAADRTIQDRLNTYAAATQMVRDHPLTGVGLENFSVLYPRYRSAESEQLTPDVLPTMVHSGYLQAAATTGIPGLLLYVLLLSSVMFVLWSAYKRQADRRARWLVVAFLASISGYLIQDLSGWLDLSLSAFFWIVLGLGVALGGEPHVARAHSSGVRRIGFAAVGLFSIVVTGLAAASLGTLRADAAAARAQRLSVMNDWPRIETDISEGLSHWGSDAVYRDKAGVRYAERFGASGERAIFERSASLLDDAHRLDPFNPYFLVHRIALETTALQKRMIKEVSRSVRDMVPVVLSMDRNNAAVYAAVARLRWAEGKVEDALPLIERGNVLRPKEGLYRVLEGDIRRGLNDSLGAMDAYRRALALLEARHPESIAAHHKLIVMLVQAGSYQDSATEADRLIARAPSDAMAYTLRGLTYQAMNDLPRARQAFATALQLKPDDENARQGLLQIEARLREVK
jgi:O-antigen ligase/tetratricopeptide (TPR) repeat protein